MNKMRYMVHCFCWLLCLAVIATAELTVTQFDGADIAWSNSVDYGTYSLMTATTLTSSWDTVAVVTNTFSTSITQSNSPAFYRIEWSDAPPVVFTNFDTYIQWSPATYLDLNGDGAWDVSLYQENLQPLDGDGPEIVQTVYVMAHRLCTPPFEAGQHVRMDIAPNSWVPSPQYQGVILGQRHNRIEGPWDGPWYSVTNAYLPVQFLISNSVHLGWVNLSPSTNFDAWRIHWGAYRPAPETMLTTGQ